MPGCVSATPRNYPTLTHGCICPRPLYLGVGTVVFEYRGACSFRVTHVRVCSLRNYRFYFEFLFNVLLITCALLNLVSFVVCLWQQSLQVRLHYAPQVGRSQGSFASVLVRTGGVLRGRCGAATGARQRQHRIRRRRGWCGAETTHPSMCMSPCPREPSVHPDTQQQSVCS